MEPTARMLAESAEPAAPQRLAFVQIATAGYGTAGLSLFGMTAMGQVFEFDGNGGGWVRLPMTEVK